MFFKDNILTKANKYSNRGARASSFSIPVPRPNIQHVDHVPSIMVNGLSKEMQKHRVAALSNAGVDDRCDGCGWSNDLCRCGLENTIWFGGTSDF